MARLGNSTSNYVMQVRINNEWKDVGLTSTAELQSDGSVASFPSTYIEFDDLTADDQNFVTSLKLPDNSTTYSFITQDTVFNWINQYSKYSITVSGNTLVIAETEYVLEK